MLDYESLSDEDKRAVEEYEDRKMKKITHNNGPINSKNKNRIRQTLDENISVCISVRSSLAIGINTITDKAYRQSVEKKFHDLELMELAYTRTKQKIC
jgi:Fic family protein